MQFRILLTTALIALSASQGFAQTARTVRFTTNVGDFNMVLNPTNDPNLQPLVDNLVAYIGLGRYHFTAVNRAADGNAGTDDDFVLQMGGFDAFPTTPDLWASLHTAVRALTPVTVDADSNGTVDFNALSNTRGTVSLALQQGNPNSGTSSFFVNLGDNSFLDSQGFVPFARIDNMAPIDRILSLTQRDLSSLAGQPGSLAYTDVPLASDDQIVVVTDVDVTQADQGFSFVGPIATALQLANRNSPTSSGLTASSLSSSSDASMAALVAEEPLLLPAGSSAAATVVPEPATAALAALSVFAAFMAGRRHRSR